MNKNNTHVSKIAEYLRKEILSCNLKAGDQITEFQISKIFNVSRVPVREAFRILHSEGYLKMIPNRGSFVRKVSKDYINEISEVYFIIAPMILKDAIPRYKESTYKKAHIILNKIEKCTDFNKVGYLIWDFGKAIYSPSKFTFMKFVMDEIYKHNIRALNDVFVKSSKMKYNVDTHRKFLELCRNKKTDEAIKLWSDYTYNISKIIIDKTVT